MIGVAMNITQEQDNVLDLFFKPRRIAIIGLARKAVNAPISVLTTLREFGFKGEICVINPNMVDMESDNIYTELDRVEAPIDTAVVTVQRALVVDVLKDCVRNNIRAAIVITQGFAEADAEGRRLQAEIVALTRSENIRVMGPNTIGICNGFSNFTSSFIEVCNETKPIGIVSQSGLFMMGHHIVNNEPAGFGMAADLGNACDISLVEILEYYEQQEQIQVIQCHLEGIEDGNNFLDVASRITRKKPVLLVKPGKSKAGQEAVASHSGAAAGENEVFQAAFDKAGIITADSAEELRVLTKAFSTYNPPKGKRVAIMSFSGGAAILAVDALDNVGLSLSRLSDETTSVVKAMMPDYIEVHNPLDIWLPVSADFHRAYPEILEQVLRDEGVDAVLCIYPSLTQPKYEAYDSSVHIRRLAGEYPEKPILCWSYGMDVSGFTREIEKEGTSMVFPTLDLLATSLVKLVEYDEHRNKEPHPVPRLEGVDVESARAIIATAKEKQQDFLFIESFEILQAYGGELADWHVARDPAELEVIAESFTYPACMKVISSDIIHKSDSGGIKLHIQNAEQLQQAYQDLHAEIALRNPGAAIDAVLVQKMVTGGKEIIIGGKRDPVFGPCVIFGAGGIYTEIFEDFAFRIAPLTEEDAYAMIDETKFARILKGARGEAPCHYPSMVDTLLRVSQMLCDHPEIQELDINPLIVNERESVIVDSRIIL